MDELERELRAINAPFANRRSAREVLALAAARRRRRRTRAAAASASVLAALLVVVIPRPGEDGPHVRERGGAVSAWVNLQAAAEGPAGLRPIADGAVLGADEAVVFRVETNAGGELSLDVDDGTRIWPPAGRSWAVDAGEHYVGDDVPLSWTPDVDPARAHRVTATLCPAATPERCPRASLVVRWREPDRGGPR